MSGRDDSSTTRFTSVLKACGDPTVKPEDVRLVRDPVLSDEAFTDTDGDCWKQSKGERDWHMRSADAGIEQSDCMQ